LTPQEPPPALHFEVCDLAQICAVREVDVRVAQVRETVAEERAQKMSPFLVDGHPGPKVAKGGHDHELRIGRFVEPGCGLFPENGSEPAWLEDAPEALVLQEDRGMGVGHHQRAALHELPSGPGHPVREARGADDELVGHRNALWQDAPEAAIVVAPDNGYRDTLRKRRKDLRHLSRLEFPRYRDAVLDIAKQNEPVRPFIVDERQYPPEQGRGLVRYLEALLEIIVLYPDVKVPYDKPSLPAAGNEQRPLAVHRLNAHADEEALEIYYLSGYFGNPPWKSV